MRRNKRKNKRKNNHRKVYLVSLLSLVSLAILILVGKNRLRIFGKAAKVNKPGFAETFGCTLKEGGAVSKLSRPKPGYLEPFIDPVFKVKITRVSGDPGVAIPNIKKGVWSSIVKPHYSLDQAWNADQSLLLLYQRQGTVPERIILDGNNYQSIKALNLSGEVRWHPKKPEILVYVDGNEIGFFNVKTEEKQVLQKFADYSLLQFGPNKGNLSLDGRVIALLAIRGSKKSAFVYDLETNRKYPEIDLNGFSNLNFVTISPLGNYLVVEFGVDNRQIFDKEGNKIGQSWLDRSPSHADLTIDEEGDEVIVGIAKSGPNDGKLVKRKLKNGKEKAVAAIAAAHTSARNIGRPGWVYGSWFKKGSLYENETLAVRLTDGLIERIGWIPTAIVDYESEPHSSPSTDGRKVILASNWGDPAGSVSSYVIEICPTTCYQPCVSNADCSSGLVCGYHVSVGRRVCYNFACASETDCRCAWQ